MMLAVVPGGTASGMQAGGTIFGMTGEAEINGGSHAWFTGYRDDDIAFATLVVLGGDSETSVQVTDNSLQKLDSYRASARSYLSLALRSQSLRPIPPELRRRCRRHGSR